MSATADTGKTRERFLEKKEAGRTRNVDISSRKKSLQQAKHARLHSDLLQTVKREPSSSGFSTGESF